MEEVNSTCWIKCPFCDGETKTKVYPDTVLINFPLYCPRCNRETKVNVAQLKMVISNEPDA